MGLGLPFWDFTSLPKVSLEESETEKERDLELDDNLKKTTQKKNRQTGTLMTDISQMADLEKDHSIHTVPEHSSHACFDQEVQALY